MTGDRPITHNLPLCSSYAKNLVQRNLCSLMMGIVTDAITLDPRRLRALAHPLRVRLLSMLRKDGPATATLLAKRADESSGATSYHLRQLAAYGFIEDDPDRSRVGRERWWRATGTYTEFRDLDFVYDPELRGVLDGWLHEVLRTQYHWIEAWLAERSEWDKSWIDAADLSDWTLRLTAEQLAGLRDDLHAVLARYGEPSAEPNAEQIVVNLHAFPRRPAPAASEESAE
jgi:DNA-binding transcriptional ArsR family regulator